MLDKANKCWSEVMMMMKILFAQNVVNFLYNMIKFWSYVNQLKFRRWFKFGLNNG